MVRKILSTGLIVGGAMALIGSILTFFTNAAFVDGNGDMKSMFATSIISRIGAILGFTAALSAVIYVFVTKANKKGFAVVATIFGTVGFIGQFLIHPFTGFKALLMARLAHSAHDITGQAAIGFVLIIIAAIGMIIPGIIGIARKDLPVFYTEMPANSYGVPTPVDISQYENIVNNNPYNNPNNNNYNR